MSRFAPSPPVLSGRLAACIAIAAPLVLAGCASPKAAFAPVDAKAAIAEQWQAPLPHAGQASELQHWWAQFDDPLLQRLIEAAQDESPTLASAAANIGDARAARVSNAAALLPAVAAVGSASRGRTDLSSSAVSTASLELQATWELDLFGANRAGVDAAEARLAASEASWHDARVSVAAEVARTYIDLRACEAHVQQAERDANSREQTARVTDAATAAGMRSPATAELARASAAEGKVIQVQREGQCALLVKALVALTALDEPGLRTALAGNASRLPAPARLVVAAVPAEVLAQRPDIHVAARDVLAASADAAQADARRWPRISLSGSIGTARLVGAGVRTDGSVWSLGPVVISFPLFDGGTRRANAQAARIRYEAATVIYAGRLRQAIHEVESALVTLDSAARRSENAEAARDGYERAYQAVAASYDAGSASVFDLEDARRSGVAAQGSLIELQRERVAAWVSLYRALGGGWSPEVSERLDSQMSPALTIPKKPTQVAAVTAPAGPRN